MRAVVVVRVTVQSGTGTRGTQNHVSQGVVTTALFDPCGSMLR